MCVLISHVICESLVEIHINSDMNGRQKFMKIPKTKRRSLIADTSGTFLYESNSTNSSITNKNQSIYCIYVAKWGEHLYLFRFL